MTAKKCHAPQWILLIAIGLTPHSLFAQQSSGAPGKSPAQRSSITRVGCQSCAASLRIMADMNCTVAVDGEKVGTIAQDAGKTVEVALGEHMVVAQSGQLKWQTTLTVDKAGQRLIQTDLQSVLRAQAWQGDWYAEVYYNQPPPAAGLPTSYYFESFEIKVSGQSCAIDHASGFVIAAAPPNSYPATHNYSACRVDNDRSLTDNIVKATLEGTDRTLAFNSIWTRQQCSLPLTDPASAKQASAKARADAQNAADQAKREIISRWQGEWSGEISHDNYVENSTSYATNRVALTIQVQSDGSCSVIEEWSNTFHYHGGDDDNPTESTNTYQCNVVDGQKLHLDNGNFSDVSYTYPGNAVVNVNAIGVAGQIDLVRH